MTSDVVFVTGTLYILLCHMNTKYKISFLLFLNSSINQEHLIFCRKTKNSVLNRRSLFLLIQCHTFYIHVSWRNTRAYFACVNEYV